METAHELNDHSVLVVEDAPLIAFAIMDCFSRAGHQSYRLPVCGES
jgi:hypothetical protein